MLYYFPMQWIWHELIFRPLINILIGLYNTIGFENLGLAIIWLTVLMRIVLLPLSIKDENQREGEQKLKNDLAELKRMFANNPSVLRDEQRKLMSQHRFRRWPRVIVLVVQALVFIILYQVFVHGAHLSQIVDVLYSFVKIPLRINTNFLGIDISHRSYILTTLCALVLFGNTWFDHALTNTKWTRSEFAFLFGFPALTFLFLILLPAVKAVFVLSTLLFSDILMVISVFKENVKEQERIIAERSAKQSESKHASLPHPMDRFK